MQLTELSNYFDLRLLSRIFMGLSAAVLICIPVQGLLSINNRTSSLPSQTEIDFSFSEQPLSFYESAFKQSSLFGTLRNESGPVVTSATLTELTKDLRLKGVVFLDTPEAIFEDARTQKSTFVRVGDSIGELTVAEIKEGGVILTRGSEKKEMRIE